ncbi:hypothetical protein [Streptomyces sp. NPDC051219]|uniref:DUF7144 family membrane protein n=1 Tax=Streptomyces sp. NPDC051219 TaxID=3155283 RepID=UPI00342A12B6
MTTQSSASTTTRPKADAGWAAGGTLFAGVLLLVTGLMSIIEGIAAIAEDDVYTRIGDYVFSFDITTWGWIHLIVGLVAAFTGWGILKGAKWARTTGIALAALNIVLQFMFLPYQPVWAVFSMGISAFVVWALATDTAELARGRR